MHLGFLAPTDAYDNHFDQNSFLDGKYALWDFFSLEMFDRVHDLAYKYYEDRNYNYNINPGGIFEDQKGSEEYIAGYLMTEIEH